MEIIIKQQTKELDLYALCENYYLIRINDDYCPLFIDKLLQNDNCENKYKTELYYNNIAKVFNTPSQKLKDMLYMITRRPVCIIYAKGYRNYANCLQKYLEKNLYDKNLLSMNTIQVEYDGKVKTINEHVKDFINSTSEDNINGRMIAYGEEVYIKKSYANAFSDILLLKHLKNTTSINDVNEYAIDCRNFVLDYKYNKYLLKNHDLPINRLVKELKRLTTNDENLPVRIIQYEVPHKPSSYEVIKNKKYISKYNYMSDNQNDLIEKMIRKYELNNISVPNTFRQADHLIKELMGRIDDKKVHRRRNWQQGYVKNIEGIYVYISNMEAIPHAAN